jgi:hypothetical protein
VFTALDVPAGQNSQKEKSQSDPNDWQHDEKSKRDPALTAVSQHKRLALLGKPGSGKSTLVNYITYCLAGEGLGDETVNLARLGDLGWTLPGLLPLRVILRDYAARGLPEGQGLWTFICANLKAKELAQFQKELEHELTRRGGLLLLDGLDEVPQAHQRREQLRQAVLDFARDFPQVRVVVTSRPYAYDVDWQLPNFARTDLLDFSREQIENYIDSWYTVTGELDPDLLPERAKQYAEQLKREVKNNRNLAELAPRPLLLALMVSLHRWHHGGGLPEKREELYDQSVDLLLDLWQRPKQIYDEKGQPVRQETSALVELGIGRDVLRNALSEVAFRAHRDQQELTGTADIPGSLLAQVLYDAPGRKENVSFDRVIEYVTDRAGLLEERGGDRDGKRIYAFPHRTFQEYLAACHLLALETYPADLVALARDQPERWRETVQLAAGRANSPALVWSLVQALCPDDLPADLSKVAEADWWGAFLAGRVLWDVELFSTTAPHLQPVLPRVKAWLAALIMKAALPPLDRAAAGDVLDRLGWLPDDLNTWVRCPGCADTGGDLLAMKYPVTNANYELFLQSRAGQQPEPRYWDDVNFGREKRAFPVVTVTWHDALAFGEWLLALVKQAEKTVGQLLEGEQALVADLTGKGVREVRLPTEAEWEKLAGGAENDRCPWDEVGGSSFKNAAVILERANTSELGWGRTTPVYAYPLGQSAPHGLMDMSGNVWEWTNSWWDREEKSRVLRGGSWSRDLRLARVGGRDNNHPSSRSNSFGFRLVAPISGP